MHHEPVNMLKAELWGTSEGERNGPPEPGRQMWDMASRWGTSARPVFTPGGKATATWLCIKNKLRTRCCSTPQIWVGLFSHNSQRSPFAAKHTWEKPCMMLLPGDNDPYGGRCGASPV